MSSGEEGNWQFLVDCAYIPDCEPRAAYVKDKLVGLIGWCRHHPEGRFLEPAINVLQTDRLGADERDVVLSRTASVRERLGYGD